ncbi:low-density lipoprotein receptor-related protein 1 [Parasteatoda tepidariorum]|uniref:low-density lipoprotein receptor-related protein 1 n=1 Tax=Parasteatoda tepidariorum TaxID=114398 RepID=UPI00077FBDF6|nr:low-density lipoprotein receptor [Parasteatoda tepidariorum]
MVILLMLSVMPIILAQMTHSNHHVRPDVQPDSLNPLERFQTSPSPPAESDHSLHHDHDHDSTLNWDPYYADEYAEYGENTEAIHSDYELATEAISSAPTSEACKENEFQCEDGSCIERQFYCDFFPECQDGSDEIDCEDEHERDHLHASADVASSWKWLIFLISFLLCAVL